MLKFKLYHFIAEVVDLIIMGNKNNILIRQSNY